MKRSLTFFLIGFLFLLPASAMSSQAGTDLIYYDKDTTISDLHINGSFDFNKKMSCFLQLNAFNFENLNFDLSDDFSYSLENLQIFTCVTNLRYKFINNFLKSASVDFLLTASSAKNGEIIGVSLNPQIPPSFGCGITANFIYDLNFSAQYLYLVPKIVGPTPNETIYGYGHLWFSDLSKNFQYNRSNLEVHAGSAFGFGDFNCDFFTDVKGLEQQFILDGNIDLLSFYGISAYSHRWKFVTLKLLTGFLYIPDMNCNVDFIMRNHIKFNFLGIKIDEWRRKEWHETPALLNNYGIFPFSISFMGCIPFKNTTLYINLAKSFVIPVDFSFSPNSKKIEIDEAFIKKILFSGLSFNFTLELQ